MPTCGRFRLGKLRRTETPDWSFAVELFGVQLGASPSTIQTCQIDFKWL